MARQIGAGGCRAQETTTGREQLVEAMGRVISRRGYAACTEGRRAQLDSLARFAELIEPEAELAQRLPARAPLMAVSGVAGLIGEELARGEGAGLADRLPELGFALLVPLLGPLAAREQIERLAVSGSA
jgi:hypothetical protein